jgi:hypothetical protein
MNFCNSPRRCSFRRSASRPVTPSFTSRNLFQALLEDLIVRVALNTPKASCAAGRIHRRSGSRRRSASARSGPTATRKQAPVSMVCKGVYRSAKKVWQPYQDPWRTPVVAISRAQTTTRSTQLRCAGLTQP